MNIIATDHDEKDLRNLVKVIKEASPASNVEGALTFNDALSLTDRKIFDLVFIDSDSKDKIKIPDFVSKLKEKFQDTHIIFVSKTKKYMPEAFSVHADAYMIKPLTSEDISREIDYQMNHYPAPLRPLELQVKTFGRFDVYFRGKRLMFKRSKSKELLAILIDNRGVGLTTREACSMLFKGRPYDEITLGYFHVVLTSLKFTLEGYGIKHLLRKSVNYIAINPNMIDCDMYRYLMGEADALKDYHGDYMINYSWSEYSPMQSDKGKKEAVNAG